MMTYIADKVTRSLSDFRYNLRLLRATTDYSGKELAKKMGMSESRVNDLEEGRMPPKIEDAIMIATFFEITLGDLFTKLTINIPSEANQQ